MTDKQFKFIIEHLRDDILAKLEVMQERAIINDSMYYVVKCYDASTAIMNNFNKLLNEGLRMDEFKKIDEDKRIIRISM
jgi:hypothetical protein